MPTLTPTLETDRLRLRPVRLSDAPAIQKLFPVWEVVRYLDPVVPWPYPDNGAGAYLERILPEAEDGRRYTWAITLRQSPADELIGIVELTPNNPTDHRGFWLGMPYHAHGYMSEAVFAVTDFAFDVLNMPELLLNNAEPNIPSHRLKEKAGATIVAIASDVQFVGGKFRKVSWKLTRDQWRANRGVFRR